MPLSLKATMKHCLHCVLLTNQATRYDQVAASISRIHIYKEVWQRVQVDFRANKNKEFELSN